LADNLNTKRANLGDPEKIVTFGRSIKRVTTNQPRTIGIDVSYDFIGN
jgi:hypothetical protein